MDARCRYRSRARAGHQQDGIERCQFGGVDLHTDALAAITVREVRAIVGGQARGVEVVAAFRGRILAFEASGIAVIDPFGPVP